MQAGEIIFQIPEDALSIEDSHHAAGERSMRNTTLQDGGTKDDSAGLEEPRQVHERTRFIVEIAGQAVQEIVQTD